MDPVQEVNSAPTTPNKVAVTAVEPVTVTVINTGSTPPVSSGVAITPSGQPNLLIKAINPIIALGVRFLHTYTVGIVAIITAGMTTDVLPVQEFKDLFILAGKLAFAGAALGSLKDAVGIFSKLSAKFPLALGEV